MRVHDPARNRQSQTQASGVARSRLIYPVEPVKDVIEMRDWDTRACVKDTQRDRRPRDRLPDAMARPLRTRNIESRRHRPMHRHCAGEGYACPMHHPGCILHRVVQQNEQQLAQAHSITRHQNGGFRRLDGRQQPWFFANGLTCRCKSVMISERLIVVA